MKYIKQLALCAVLTISAFCALMYSSCQKDTCKGVTCLNKSTCSAGSCQCPVGISGANCETVYRKMYDHVYQGSSPDPNNASDSTNTLTFIPDELDTANYNTMHMRWTDTAAVIVDLPITLANNSASGSVFTIESTNAGNVIYSGGGTISSTSVTMTLKETFTGGAVVELHFNNYYIKK